MINTRAPDGANKSIKIKKIHKSFELIEMTKVERAHQYDQEAKREKRKISQNEKSSPV